MSFCFAAWDMGRSLSNAAHPHDAWSGRDVEPSRRRSNTHSVNTDQRRLALNGTITTGFQPYTYTMDALPNNGGILLPGPWMLFAINGAGVPSTAVNVMVSIC